MEFIQKKNKVLPKKPVSEAITIEDIYLLGQNLNETQVRILYYVLYLSGARISEALNMRIKDISYSTMSNGNKIIIFNLITEKNKKHPLRSIPACYYSASNSNDYIYENKMVSEIKNFAFDKSIRMGDNTGLLFNINRLRAWRVFTKNMITSVRAKDAVTGKPIENYEKKINPHYLRHCRLSHLRILYGADAVSLMQFAGWSNMNMCRTYLHLGYKELAKMFG